MFKLTTLYCMATIRAPKRAFLSCNPDRQVFRAITHTHKQVNAHRSGRTSRVKLALNHFSRDRQRGARGVAQRSQLTKRNTIAHRSLRVLKARDSPFMCLTGFGFRMVTDDGMEVVAHDSMSDRLRF